MTTDQRVHNRFHGKRKKRQPYTRREGVCLKPDALDALMAVKGIGSGDLVKLTGLDYNTITGARQGRRIRRQSLLAIVAALDRLPDNPTAAALVGLAAAPVTKKPTRKRAA